MTMKLFNKDGMMSDKALNINIEEAPPTLEKINRCRKQSSKTEGRRVVIDIALSIEIIVLLTILTFADRILLDVLILPFILFVTVSLFFVARYLLYTYRRSEKTSGVIDSLGGLNDRQVIEYESLISEYPVIRNYYKKIKTMNREPVVADLKAAKEWESKIPARSAQERMALV